MQDLGSVRCGAYEGQSGRVDLNRSVDGLECTVVGGGASGLSTALACAKMGLEVGLIAPKPGDVDWGDGRTAALFGPSIRFLGNIGAWEGVREDSCAVYGIRLVDGSKRLFRSPEVVFRAEDVGLSELGFNVPNNLLVQALWERVHDAQNVTWFDGLVDTIETHADGARIRLRGGQGVKTRLVIACDGRRSLCRERAGITATTWSYSQSAVVTRFSHGRGHDGISTEVQCVDGPCTTVPMPGSCSALVWVVRGEEAARLGGLGATAFQDLLECQLKGLLGTVGPCDQIQSFPLSGLQVDVLGRNRVALVGEAGHVVPPIGAQGLNMGLADAAVIAELAAGQCRRGGDPGGDEVLWAYDARRRVDVAWRSQAVDALNRTYLMSPWSDIVRGSPFEVLDWRLCGALARGAGLHLLALLPHLRRELMRAGLGPSSLPELMT